MEVGDKVTWNGHIGVITDIERPRCKCKGKGNYLIELNGVIKKIPITTKLEPYNPIGLINTNIPQHKL
jgi:hypothetical protein